MLLYHGTNEATAQAIVTNPNTLTVSKGGGELGQGFYTIEHVWMAISWAKMRYQNLGKVLEASVDPARLATLSVRTLTHQEVLNLWNQLKMLGQTRTHQIGYDVIYGPLATYPHLSQEKFESANAEALLQKSKWKVL